MAFLGVAAKELLVFMVLLNSLPFPPLAPPLPVHSQTITHLQSVFSILPDREPSYITISTNDSKLFNVTIPNLGISISDGISKTDCRWNNTACFTECTFANFTANVTNAVINSTIINSTDKELAFWTEFSDNAESICNVTKCESDVIQRYMFDKMCGQTSRVKDLKRLLIMKKACHSLLTQKTFVHNYISAERLCLHGIINILFEETTKDYDFGSLAMTVVRMDRMNKTDSGLVKISAQKVFDNLPLDIQIPMESFENVSENQSSVGVVTYASSQHFESDQSNGHLTSQVIRVEVPGRKIKNLSTQLAINFTITNTSAITGKNHLLCHFYDEEGYRWSSNGSSTYLDYVNSSNTVQCSYDHMTPFAVLLVDLPEIDEKSWKILSIISYIGCGLSLFFSVVSIVIYKTYRGLKHDNSNSIHASLSAALFLLNTSFLLSEWAVMWSQESLCVFIAVMIEYSLLSCFTWMVIEAIHLYLLLIKVFSIYVKRYMLKLSLFGWGVPAVLVGTSLSVYNIKPFYGTKIIKLTDTNESAKICWITDISFLYGMNITYFSITFLFNTAILVSVTLQIFRLQRLDARVKMSRCKDISTVLGLTCLLGVTWGLAFFSEGYINLPVLYLFCICNTLQGLFLFLWICGTIRKNKCQVSQKSTMSDPMSFMN